VRPAVRMRRGVGIPLVSNDRRSRARHGIWGKSAPDTWAAGGESERLTGGPQPRTGKWVSGSVGWVSGSSSIRIRNKILIISLIFFQ
jgi:hypothetical protein